MDNQIATRHPNVRKVLLFILGVVVLLGLSYWIASEVHWLYRWTFALTIAWLILTVIITRIKPEKKETAWGKIWAYPARIILSVMNFLLLVSTVLIQLTYSRLSLWWGVVPAAIWIIFLFVLASSNHKRNSHPQEDLPASNYQTNDQINDNQDVRVTRELMLELGLPTQAKTTINMADFEHALEQSVRARMDEAQAHKIESIVAALNSHPSVLSVETASSQILETLGLLPRTEPVSKQEESARKAKSTVSTTRTRKGWKL